MTLKIKMQEKFKIWVLLILKAKLKSYLFHLFSCCYMDQSSQTAPGPALWSELRGQSKGKVYQAQNLWW